MNRAEAYRILELGDNATKDVIRKAQRRLLLKFHPDRHATLPDAHRAEMLHHAQRINAAADFLLEEASWSSDEWEDAPDWQSSGGTDTDWSDPTEPRGDLEPELILQTIESARELDWFTVLNCARELAQFVGYEYESNRYRSEALFHLGRPQEALNAAHEARRLRSWEHYPLYLVAVSHHELGNRDLARMYIEDAIGRTEQPPISYTELLEVICLARSSTTATRQSRYDSSKVRPQGFSKRRTPLRGTAVAASAGLFQAYLDRAPSLKLGVSLSFASAGLVVIGAVVAMFGYVNEFVVCIAIAVPLLVLAIKEVCSNRLSYREATLARTTALSIAAGIGLTLGFTAIVSGFAPFGLASLACGAAFFVTAIAFSLSRKAKGGENL